MGKAGDCPLSRDERTLALDATGGPLIDPEADITLRCFGILQSLPLCFAHVLTAQPSPRTYLSNEGRSQWYAPVIGPGRRKQGGRRLSK